MGWDGPRPAEAGGRLEAGQRPAGQRSWPPRPGGRGGQLLWDTIICITILGMMGWDGMRPAEAGSSRPRPAEINFTTTTKLISYIVL